MERFVLKKNNSFLFNIRMNRWISIIFWLDAKCELYDPKLDGMPLWVSGQF